MPVWSRVVPAAVAAFFLVFCAPGSPPLLAQTARGAVTVSIQSPAQLRDWDRRVDGMLRNGELRVRQTRDDTLVPGRTHQRADQYYRGVRVFGADVVRQLVNGATESMFGTIYEGIDLDPAPGINEDRARSLLEQRTGATIDPSVVPELVVLPLDAGGYALTWRLRVTTRTDARQYFIDARTGAAVLDYSDRKGQATVGRARGVLGDTKKISVTPNAGQFVTSDELRPASIQTYDMRGNPFRVEEFLNRRITLSMNDLASDSDNDWTDGAAGDAHVYAGWTYDYFFKRFGRHGLDNADVRLRSIVHPVNRSDVFTHGEEFPDFFINAFYDGSGVVLFGEGLPAGFTIDGQTWDFLACALDIVAHELAHGVTEFTSNLIYRNESGALNEAFSDMMGTGAEFFFQQPGDAALRGDYLIGEDAIRPGGLRSMADPASKGDPDHYSRRFRGTEDNGGVHINSGIPNQVFYLAIEGGTNRTSGLSVQGVGAANRDQIEKVFFRTVTQLLPSNATFAVARAASIQAARDLLGANSPAERAVTQAWTAVGVN
jgi:Zn-dependent metalloprotease